MQFQDEAMCNMKIEMSILMLVGALLRISAASVDFLHTSEHMQKQDTIIRMVQRDGDRAVTRKMSHSAYPVQMSVVGNAVRVESPENQILPIYTHTGTFYLIVRLNKGTNWLNGLSKGRYFINNRLIAIK